MEESRESGIDSGARNVGRFFLSLVPWALGVGALVWLSVYIGVHTFYHEIQQEQRAATYIGAAERPKSKIKIEVKEVDCSRVTRADLDGTDLLVYAENDCHRETPYWAWHWSELSPDGTVLNDGYENWRCPKPDLHEKAECRIEIPDDDRIATVKVWTQTEP